MVAGVVSTTHLRVGLVTTLFAWSVALTTKVCSPFLKLVKVVRLLQVLKALPSKLHSSLIFAAVEILSEALIWKTAVVLLLLPIGPLTLKFGGVRS